MDLYVWNLRESAGYSYAKEARCLDAKGARYSSAKGERYSGSKGARCSRTLGVVAAQFVDDGGGAPIKSTFLTKGKLASKIKMKDLALMYEFLGLEVW